ncbi:MAG TPA: aldo/keto reductase, partial [bacterium]|nr:aldo/keto reductase [bacterium]
ELDIAIIAYSPLAQGLLTGKYHEDPNSIKTKKGYRKMMGSFKGKKLQKTRPLIDKLKEIGQKYEVSPAQVALNWTVNYHKDRILAIPGASNVNQAESNAKSMQINLTLEDMEQINRVSKNITEI